jgi:hypothetical protein
MTLEINWLTIISFTLNLVLSGLGIYQFVTSKKEEENTKSRVRDWQNHAEGVKNALLQISQNPSQYSDKGAVISAVSAVAQSAVTLDKVFVEERFYSDEDVKRKREEAEREIKDLFSSSSSRSIDHAEPTH